MGPQSEASVEGQTKNIDDGRRQNVSLADEIAQNGSAAARASPESSESSTVPLLEKSTPEYEEPRSQSVAIDVPESGERDENGSICTCGSVTKFLKSKLLAILTIAGIVLGFALGLGIRELHPSSDTLMWIGFPGEMFLKLLKMTIVPLIVSSVITATASMDPKQNGKIGAIQVSYLTLTNLLGAVMGLILGATIKPGQHLLESGESNVTESSSTDSAALQTQDIVADLLRNLVPDNIVRATLQKAVTSYEEVIISDRNASVVISEMRRNIGYTNSSNVLGMIMVCVIFGLAAGKAKEKGRPFLEFFRAASEIVLIIIGWFLWVSPIGICSLIAASLASIDDISTTFIKLGLFVVAVVSGILLHQLIIMPAIHFVSVRTNPFTVLAKSTKAWMVGFASSSSAGSMPYMYEIAESYNIDKRVSSFCIPIGVTLNADGSALFICTSVLFLAQMHNIVLDAAQMAVIGILTTISTLALPSVPSSSLVVIVIICTTFAVPASSIGLLFAVEWFLDRLRTTSNVVTEIFAFIFVWHMTKDDLEKGSKFSKGAEAADIFSVDTDSSTSTKNKGDSVQWKNDNQFLADGANIKV